LVSLRDAIDEAGVELLTILIDDGDITHPEHGERDVAWIAEWLQIGEDLGAKRARVIAGKQAGGTELLAVSAERLRGLAQGSILRVETENWFPLLENAKSVNTVLDRTGDSVGLCADFGNWPRSLRYDELPHIFHRAETCHAKFDFVDATQLDKEDADRLMDISIQSGFKGNYVIVNGGIGEFEWDAIDIQKGQILASLG
jgi:sugar phosphate isomerase/epimerase